MGFLYVKVVLLSCSESLLKLEQNYGSPALINELPLATPLKMLIESLWLHLVRNFKIIPFCLTNVSFINTTTVVAA